MSRPLISLALLGFLGGVGWAEDAKENAADEVFSGPQVGEKLTSFKVRGASGDDVGKEVDYVARADGGPTVLVFFHKRTRPAFGLTRALMQYAGTRKADKLSSAVVWLTEDATETENWLKAVQRNFPKDMVMGISPDGIEGPGAYGLNRNVTLTVLVAKDSKVTANFALVQPSVEADLPKILKAVVDVAGGKVPDLKTLVGREMARPAANERDPQMTALLRELINKEATAEEVEATAKKLDAHFEKTPAAQRQIGEITGAIIKAERLDQYGTEPARKHLKRWAEKYGKKTE